MVFHFDGLASPSRGWYPISRSIPFSRNIRNIVVLRAFQLVLLYYFTLRKVLARNTFCCQDKNIDILGAQPSYQSFLYLHFAAGIQSRSVLHWESGSC
jgi:hypothetical protein